MSVLQKKLESIETVFFNNGFIANVLITNDSICIELLFISNKEWACEILKENNISLEKITFNE